MRLLIAVAVAAAALARSQTRDGEGGLQVPGAGAAAFAATPVGKYLSFREARLERRLNRSRAVLANLEARYTYVLNALTFQNYKATELVQRAANDSVELQTDQNVTAALQARLPSLQLLVNSTLREDLGRFGHELDVLRKNVSELLEDPLGKALDEINGTVHNRTGEFQELERATGTVEEEVQPWAKNFTREARRLTTDHVDGLLVDLADNFAQKVKASAEILKAAGEENVTNATSDDVLPAGAAIFLATRSAHSPP